MVSSFLAIALSILFLNQSCNTKRLPSIASKENGLVAHSLLPLQNSKSEEGKLLCLSKGCVKAAASLINKMDRSVDPCDDFYQFACGSFLKNTILDDDNQSENEFQVVDDAITNWKRMILNEPIQPDELRPFKMMKLLYKSCMDQENIEKTKGLEPIKEMLKSIGGWPVLEAEKWNGSNFTLMNSMLKLIVPDKKWGVDYFFKLQVVPHPYNNTVLFLYLDKASLGLKSKDLVKGKDHELVEKYYRHIVDIAVLFGADQQRATKELSESLDFEIELAKIEEQISKIEYRNKPVSIHTLQRAFPSITWKEFLNKLLNKFIGREDFVMLSSTKLLGDLVTLLNKTPKRVQANYVIQRSVIDSLKYLTEELRKREYKYTKELNPSHIEDPRWKYCVSTSTKLFNLAIGSLYVRRFFNENAKQNALEMVNGIKEELYKTLSSNEWMDDKTRENAMDKAKAMTHSIAYPDELLDDSKLNAYYENLEVNDQDFYTSVLNLTKFNVDYAFSKLRNSFNKSDGIILINDITEVNAFYQHLKNNIVLPAGILQGAFFSNDRPQYMIYGGLGFVIAHEITHGFDNTGKKYDMHGNNLDWWTEETNKRFLEKQKCFINQYGNFTVHEIGLKVDGNRTLGDNMADNGGLKLAYDAYRVWANGHDFEPRLPGLQEYTPQQMFWLSIANVWCSKKTLERQKNFIMKDEHSPNRFRIIGSFSNTKSFSDDFRCPLGSNMNPVKKCRVW